MEGSAPHSGYYKINQILMTSIGQWPYQSPLSSRGYLSLLVFLSTTQIVPQILAVIKYRQEPGVVLESLTPFLVDVLCFSKLVTCMVKSKERLKMQDRIESDWKVWANDREIAVIQKYATTGKNINVFYTITIYTTGILFITQPILPKIIDVLVYNGTNCDGDFPFPVYYNGWVDEQKNYFYIIGYTYICVLEILLITVATDTMLIAYVQHGCGLFAALGEKLKRTGEHEKSINGNDVVAGHLHTCIDRHNDAIEFAKLIESTYSGCFFFAVGVNMLMMSVTGVQIVTRNEDPKETIRYVAFVIVQMIHLYVDSYFSQILMDHSTSIRDYIHNGRWYNIPVKSQKLLSFMTMRCNFPCKLTAGKICPMSVETFAAVLKTSMSYFTLLRSMQ